MRTISRYYDFSGGLNTRDAPELVGDNEVADCLNVVFREAGVVKTREGHSLYATLPSTIGDVLICDCDEYTAWTIDSPGSLSNQSETEGPSSTSLKVTRPLGYSVCECESFSYWNGVYGRSSGNQYSGSYCLSFLMTYKYRYYYPPSNFVSCEATYDPGSFDFSYLEEDAEFEFFVNTCSYAHYAANGVNVRLRTDAYNYYFYEWRNLTPGTWVRCSVEKGLFSSYGNPDWANINDLWICFYALVPISYEYGLDYLDQIRFVETTAYDVLSRSFTPALDLSSYRGADALTFWFKPGAGEETLSSKAKLRLKSGDAYVETGEFSASLEEGWQKFTQRIEDLTESGTFDWSEVDGVELHVKHGLDYGFAEEDLDYRVDEIGISPVSKENRVMGLYEYVKRDGTTYRVAVAAGNFVDLADPDTVIYDGLSDADCSFATMHDECIIANGSDYVMYWDGATFDDLGSGNEWPAGTGRPPKCKYLKVHKNRLFCFGLTGDGLQNYLVFSELGNPALSEAWPVDNWIYVGPDSGGLPTGMEVLQDALVLFKTDGVWLLMGDDPYNFNLNQLEECPGCPFPKSLALAPQGVFYLSYDGVYVFDGAKSVNISGKISPSIRSLVYGQEVDDVVATFYDDYYICWVVPEGSASGNAFVFDTRTNTWSLWEGPAFSSLAVMGKELYGGSAYSSQVSLCFDGYDDLGGAIRTYVKTKRYNFGQPEMHKFFHHLYIVARGSANDYSLSCSANTHNPTESRSFTVNLFSPDDDLVIHRETIALRGKYLEVEVENEGVNEPVGLYGLTIAYKSRRVK